MACLSMILYRRTERLYDQEMLAMYFGVRISAEYQDAFAEKMPLLTSHNYDEGVKTIELGESVKAFFEKEGINLECAAIKASTIENLEQWIEQSLEWDADIWCEYVYGDLSWWELYLHDGLIESYDATRKEVTMINPEGTKKNRFQISITELFERISGKYSRETGFLLISKM